MTDSSQRSPHYSVDVNRIGQKRSDAEVIIRRAHDAVRYIATLDGDRAAVKNGLGFSKSDVSRGHALARWPFEVVIRSKTMATVSMALARKYRRQLPPRLQVDQPRQSTMNI